MLEPKKFKILIVEDDIALSEMYKMKFTKEWFEAEVAENGFNAIVKLQQFQPDAILLDIMMPDMDWFEALRVIREQTSMNTKIIMFTNLDKKEDIDKALNSGADDYVIKANITPKEIVEKVLGLLQSWKRQVRCPHCGTIFSIDD